MQKNWLPSIIVTALTFLFGSAALSQELNNNPIISGKVIDQQHNPIKHVKVSLLDLTSNKITSMTTNASGLFEFSHPDGHSCTLSIEPKPESNFACAYIENIPGSETRQFVVQVKPGYPVSGRVTAFGDGVKRAIIRVTSNKTEDEHSIHGGGRCTTNGDGQYMLLLTKGPKLFTIRNEQFSQLPNKKIVPINIIGAEELPDIDISQK